MRGTAPDVDNEFVKSSHKPAKPREGVVVEFNDEGGALARIEKVLTQLGLSEGGPEAVPT